MVALDLVFTTVRADVESVGRELDQTVKDSRIVFGPGFQPELTNMYVNAQTMDEIIAWGSEDASE